MNIFSENISNFSVINHSVCFAEMYLEMSNVTTSEYLLKLCDPSIKSTFWKYSSVSQTWSYSFCFHGSATTDADAIDYSCD